MKYQIGDSIRRNRTGERFTVTATPDDICLEDSSIPAYELKAADGVVATIAQSVVESADYHLAPTLINSKQTLFLIKVREPSVPIPAKLPVGYVMQTSNKEQALKMTATGYWRYANGAVVAVTDYPELFKAIGYTFTPRTANVHVPVYGKFWTMVLSWFGKRVERVVTVGLADFDARYFNLPNPGQDKP